MIDGEMFGRYSTGLSTAFLHRLTERHDLFDTVILVGSFGYRTFLARLGLHDCRNHTDKNLIKNLFQTLTQRIDRVHHSRVGSRKTVR